MDSDGDNSSVASSDLDEDEMFTRTLRRVRRNDYRVSRFYCSGIYYDIAQGMMNEEWEDLGRDISNNTYLGDLDLNAGALNDEKLTSLFTGLTRSRSIEMLALSNNAISVAGLRTLEPFLKKSTNLRRLHVSYTNIQTDGFNFLMRTLLDTSVELLYCDDCGITSIEIETVPKNLRFFSLSDNNIQSEGFNRLLRSLCDSSIESLCCNICHIESIDIDTNSFPRSLKELNLTSNRINSNGCHEITKLLQEGGIALEKLNLGDNLIDDEGVAILVDALKMNTSLEYLCLEDNNGISDIGRIMMLTLLNDTSSIKSTLQSNHTLQTAYFGAMNDDIHRYINMATACNRNNAVRAGRLKVIQTQLHSQIRTELVEMQGVQSQSVYGEIKPLHLPEVLSSVGRRHGKDELYIALKASIAEVMSTVNRKRWIQQCIADHDSIIANYESIIANYESMIAEHRAEQRELREELASVEEES